MPDSDVASDVDEAVSLIDSEAPHASRLLVAFTSQTDRGVIAIAILVSCLPLAIGGAIA